MISLNHGVKEHPRGNKRDRRPGALSKPVFFLAIASLVFLASAHLGKSTNRDKDRRPNELKATMDAEPLDYDDCRLLGIGAGDPQNIYVATLKHYPKEWASSLLRSDDGGNTWLEMSKLPILSFPRLTLQYPNYYSDYYVSPVTPGLLFASESESGLYASWDFGATWSQISPLKIYNLKFHPSNNLIIYGLCDNAVWRSLDAGKNWEPIFQPPLPYFPSYPSEWQRKTVLEKVFIDPHFPNVLYTAYHYLITNPKDPYSHIYIRIPGALLRSTDGGNTWGPVMFPAEVVSLSWMVFDPFPTGRILMHLSDNFWKSVDNGMTWERIEHPDPCLFFYQPPQPDPCTPEVLYSWHVYGDKSPLRMFISEDWGASFQPLDLTFTYFKFIALEKAPACAIYVNAVLFNADTEDVIFKSSDKGKSWIRIAPRLIVNLEKPQDRATVRGITPIKATVDSWTGTYSVDFYIDEGLVQTSYFNQTQRSGIQTFSYDWDTRFYTVGEHEIRIIVKDSKGGRENKKITVKIENVKVSLTGRLAWEKAWIVRGFYAALNCLVENVGNVDIAKYQILADDDGEPQTVVKEFTFDQVKGNTIVWMESWGNRKSRNYQVVALDSAGTRVGISNIITLKK